MSINNFRSARLTKAGDLIVQGKTTEDDGNGDANLPVGAQMEVIVIADNGDGERFPAEVVEVASSDWHAELAAGTHPFIRGDVVCAVGALDIPGDPRFLWGKTFTIDERDPLK
jgi:hypothetical protein